ncbi:MAG: hypothetical protein M5Z89_23890, partial [Olivibacter sp.]|nr:hypothetical protein [Olivibacter sp. UJ_SKK_5.1]
MALTTRNSHCPTSDTGCSHSDTFRKLKSLPMVFEVDFRQPAIFLSFFKKLPDNDKELLQDCAKKPKP